MLNSKRVFDVLVSAIALATLLPLFLAAALFIVTDTKGPVFFRQTRVGRYGRHFQIWKFRTMLYSSAGSPVTRTATHDSRITAAGHFLRRTKLDELPQLWNVLNGTMSLVGPRPIVPEQVGRWTAAERRALELAPGITDFASLRFHDEQELLTGHHDVHAAYETLVRAEKHRLVLRYIEERSMVVDVRILFDTFRVLVWNRAFSRAAMLRAEVPGGAEERLPAAALGGGPAAASGFGRVKRAAFCLWARVFRPKVCHYALVTPDNQIKGVVENEDYADNCRGIAG